MCSLERRGRVFVLTLTGDGDHCLSPTTISDIRDALSRVKSESASLGGRGFALVTTSEGRFFSNGLDLSWVRSGESPSDRLVSLISIFGDLITDLISLPMPTIAAIAGHAAAAGFILALSHDYAEMRGDRGVLYMSEIDLGMPLPPYMRALLREKIADPRVLRDVALGGKKIGAEEAAQKGIIDRAHSGGPEEALEAALRRADELAARNWAGEIYASIRRGLLPQVCDALGLPQETLEDARKLVQLAAKL